MPRPVEGSVGLDTTVSNYLNFVMQLFIEMQGILWGKDVKIEFRRGKPKGMKLDRNANLACSWLACMRYQMVICKYENYGEALLGNVT